MIAVALAAFHFHVLRPTRWVLGRAEAMDQNLEQPANNVDNQSHAVFLSTVQY
jgi:hypothetical protein